MLKFPRKEVRKQSKRNRKEKGREREERNAGRDGKEGERIRERKEMGFIWAVCRERRRKHARRYKDA